MQAEPHELFPLLSWWHCTLSHGRLGSWQWDAVAAWGAGRGLLGAPPISSLSAWLSPRLPVPFPWCPDVGKAT